MPITYYLNTLLDQGLIVLNSKAMPKNRDNLLAEVKMMVSGNILSGHYFIVHSKNRDTVLAYLKPKIDSPEYQGHIYSPANKNITPFKTPQ